MTDTPMPGTPIDLPIPPDLCQALGYRGDARYVSFYFSPCGDEAVYSDGRSMGSAATWAYLAYRRHRAVDPILRGWNLGYSDLDAEYCLIIDREASRASVAPRDEAAEFLHSQHPSAPALSPEEMEAFSRRLDGLAARLREAPVHMDAVMREVDEQRGRVGRMVSFLDMCPTPPSRGRG